MEDRKYQQDTDPATHVNAPANGLQNQIQDQPQGQKMDE
jgi:hypothetical protein